MGQVKVATRTSTFVWRKDDFSPTVQRNCMKLRRLVAPDSGCLNPILWHSSSFRFGAENVLFWTRKNKTMDYSPWFSAKI